MAKFKNLEELDDEQQVLLLLAIKKIQERRAKDLAATPPIPDRLVPPEWHLSSKEPTPVNSYNFCD